MFENLKHFAKPTMMMLDFLGARYSDNNNDGMDGNNGKSICLESTQQELDCGSTAVTL